MTARLEGRVEGTEHGEGLLAHRGVTAV